MPPLQQEVRTRALTEREQELWEAGRAALKSSPGAVNDILGRVLTLATALIGGGFAAAKVEVMPFWWAAAVVGLLCVAVLACFSGLWPKEYRIDPDDLSQLEDWDARRYDRLGAKVDAARVASGLLAVALGVALAGMVAGRLSAPAASSPTPKQGA